MFTPPGSAQNLRLDPHGYWVAGGDDRVSYPEEGNSHCFAVEDGSFWFGHRNGVIVEAVRQFPPGGPLVDVGGGNGFVSRGLEEAGFPTILVEPGRTGAANACRRGLSRVICATAEAAGFPPGSAAAAGLFDVLEHIPDDEAFLRQLHAMLRPDGRVYLTVPAFRWLWSREDEFAGHHRRYTRRTLGAVLRAAGFEVEYLTYFFCFLPLPVLLFRVLPGRLGFQGRPTTQTARREHAAPGGPAGRLLARLLAWERKRVARRRVLPLGGSCLAVARRR